MLDLFEGHRQLIVYHFMFDPNWDKGCPGCTGYVDALGDLSMLEKRDTTFALVSRAPLSKLQAYAAQKGWNRAWYSSLGSDFNYDFHVTLDESVAPVEYGYRPKAEMLALNVVNPTEGEEHGISVFFRIDDDVYHTYSTYARGTESITDAYRLLDLTPTDGKKISKIRRRVGRRNRRTAEMMMKPQLPLTTSLTRSFTIERHL